MRIALTSLLPSLLVGVALAAVLAGCANASGDGGPDAGRDGGTDPGRDAGADSGIDDDQDGSPLPDDCDDTNPAIRPGIAEVCHNAIDDDCDALADCQDATCNTMPCSTSGFCTGSVCIGPNESPCTDGLDNNNNGLIDCADPDCAPGSTCSDSNSCTLGDQCAAAGSCDGTPVTCPLPSNVCLSLGTCQEPAGTCFYPPRPSGSSTCSDGVNCTINDTCDGDGGCAGTLVSCPSPTQCHTASTGCDTGGGCLYGSRSGQACDAGAGLGSATCDPSFNCNLAPPSLFPYGPSNFVDTDLPGSGVALTIGTDRTLNTGGTPTLSNTTMPPFTIFTPTGGVPTVLIRLTSFTVSPGQTLTLTGARPVIFAVLGDVTISGTVVARNSGTPAACGYGGNGLPGGGGGGGYATDGGAGGGELTNLGATQGGLSGSANGDLALLPLRGGCYGGTGSGRGGMSGGGGPAGGAVQISASGSLSVTSSGTVTAPGRGGGAGSVGGYPSGGGGGSGGAILLEASSIVVDQARITANGGGGGAGRYTATGTPGADGRSDADVAADGGVAVTGAGNGGSGATRSFPAQRGADPTVILIAGGGGGGGAVGRIRLNARTSCSVTPPSVISPAASSGGTAACPP